MPLTSVVSNRPWELVLSPSVQLTSGDTHYSNPQGPQPSSNTFFDVFRYAWRTDTPYSTTWSGALQRHLDNDLQGVWANYFGVTDTNSALTGEVSPPPRAIHPIGTIAANSPSAPPEPFWVRQGILPDGRVGDLSIHMLSAGGESVTTRDSRLLPRVLGGTTIPSTAGPLSISNDTNTPDGFLCIVPSTFVDSLGRTFTKGVHFVRLGGDFFAGELYNAPHAGTGTFAGTSLVVAFTGSAPAHEWGAFQTFEQTTSNINTAMWSYHFFEPTNDPLRPRISMVTRRLPNPAPNRTAYTQGPQLPAADYYGMAYFRTHQDAPQPGNPTNIIPFVADAGMWVFLAKPTGGVFGLYGWNSTANTLTLLLDMTAQEGTQPRGLRMPEYRRLPSDVGKTYVANLLSMPKMTAGSAVTGLAPGVQYNIRQMPLAPSTAEILTSNAVPLNGTVPISFKLTDNAPIVTSLIVKVRVGQFGSLVTSNGISGGATRTGLNASPVGVTHSITWDISADALLPPNTQEIVSIRLEFLTPAKNIGVFVEKQFLVSADPLPARPRNTFVEKPDNTIVIDKVLPESIAIKRNFGALVLRGSGFGKRDSVEDFHIRAVVVRSNETLQIFKAPQLLIVETLPGIANVINVKNFQFNRVGIYEVLCLDKDNRVVARRFSSIRTLIEGGVRR